MKLCCISDTHGMHRRIVDMPPADVLIHAGDISNAGELDQIVDCVDWMGSLPYKHRILIGGNHDFSLDRHHPRGPKYIGFKQLCAERGVDYLEGERLVIDGVNFWGGPWVPNLPMWAFPEKGNPWAAIPNDTHVLITHGPAWTVGDLVGEEHQVQVGLGTHVGSKKLEKAIDFLVTRGNLLAHVCGHIHESYGVRFRKGITSVVASTCTRMYKPTNLPIVIEVEP